jgi:hypothetical protein
VLPSSLPPLGRARIGWDQVLWEQGRWDQTWVIQAATSAATSTPWRSSA